MHKILLALLITYPLLGFSQVTDQEHPEPEFSNRIIGDVGLAGYTSQLNIKSNSSSSTVLPYVFADFNRLSLRIDTLGLKTVKMGYGYLELSGRINLDSYKINAINNQQSVSKNMPLPLGLGTFQETPVGAFQINFFHDYGKSKGDLQELIYFAEFKLGSYVTIYPQLGVERASSNYANYYYGINQNESNVTGYNVYTPHAVINTMTGLAIEIPLADHLYLTSYGKRKWLDDKASKSPIFNRSYQDTFFMGVIYRFE